MFHLCNLAVPLLFYTLLANGGGKRTPKQISGSGDRGGNPKTPPTGGGGGNTEAKKGKIRSLDRKRQFRSNFFDSD